MLKKIKKALDLYDICVVYSYMNKRKEIKVI